MKEALLEIIKIWIKAWDELLSFIGGKLELSKYKFYFIDWEFDKNWEPIIKENNAQYYACTIINIYSIQTIRT